MGLRLRRGAVAATAIAALAAPPAAAGVTITHRSYVDHGDTAGPWTSTAVDIGAADASRVVGVLIYVGHASGQATVTINGTAATPVVRSAAGTRIIDYWELAVPTGTTADIVITSASGGTRAARSIFTVTGQSTPGYTARNNSTPQAEASNTSCTLPSVAGSVLVAGAFVNGVGAISWSGAPGATHANDQVGGGPQFSTFSTSPGGVALTPFWGGAAALWRSLAVGYS
jgi:hypothetical protein